MTDGFSYTWLAANVAVALMAVRLIWLGLARRYPILLLFLVLSVIQTAVAFAIFQSSPEALFRNVYVWYWTISRLLTLVLYFCILIELSTRIFEGYRGFQRLGQLIMYFGVAGIAVLVAVTVLLQPSVGPQALMNMWFLQERSAYFGLTIVFLVLVLFAGYFHLRPPANVRLLFGVFGIWFAGEAALWSIRSHFGNEPPSPADTASFVLFLCCFTAGAVGLSKAGEQLPKPALPFVLDKETEAALLEKLESYNKALSKLLRP